MYFLILLAIFAHAQLAQAQIVQTTEDALTLGLDSEEQDAASRINQLRILAGVAPLILDPSLQNAARAHSIVMDTNQVLSHDETGPTATMEQRIKIAGGDFSAEAENIACGSASGLATFNQWLHSPGHLENMLGEDYQSLGIARVGAYSQNSITCAHYWTVDFGGKYSADSADDTISNPITMPSLEELRRILLPYLPHPSK